MSESAPINVLVVDDHRLFVDALVEFLGTFDDVKVIGTANNLAQLTEALATLDPDVVLLDYRFPDGDGVTGTSIVRRLRPGAKVVMVTGADDDAVMIRAIEAGCAGFVTKDNAADQAVAALRAAAAGEAVISPQALSKLLPRMRRGEARTQAELTPRELEVLKLLANGATNKAIADELVISPHTVRNHVQSILSKLEAHSKLEAVAAAVRQGLIRFRS